MSDATDTLKQIISVLSTELITAIQAAVNRSVIITPISQYADQPKRDSTKRREEARSRIDYDFEMKQTSKMWDNPKDGPGAEVGGLFGFLHKTQDRVEIHRVEIILSAKYGRPHWVNPREALNLSNKLGEMTFKQFKKLVVSGTGEPWKDTLNRVPGTRRTQWNPELDFIIRQELAQRNQEPAQTKARIWTKEEFPVDQDILEICEGHVEDGNFHPNEIQGAAMSIQMLLDEGSHRRGICGADIQSGKTGIQVLVASSFRQAAVARGELPPDTKLGIIHVLNISDTGIKNQIREKGFERKFRRVLGEREKILRCNSDDSTFLYLDMLSGGAENRIDQVMETLGMIGCTHFLIISDETQSAINPLQQFGVLLKRQFGINPVTVGESSWLLGVTATPSRFYAPLSDGLQITLCWVESGDCYYGLKRLVADERIRQIPAFRSVEHIKELFSEAMVGQDDKYLLIRANPTAHLIDEPDVRVEVAIKQALTELGYMYTEFNSKKKNISELLDALSAPPSKKYLGTAKRALIIKGAARAGITFPVVKHVGAAFESFKGNDAVVQSLAGRFCGNQPDRRVGPVIYTQKNIVDEYLVDRKAISEGVVPEPNGGRGGGHLGFFTEPKILCVDPNAEDGKSTIEKHAEQLRRLGVHQMHHWLTENKRNHMKDLVAGKMTHPQRIFHYGSGEHKFPETEMFLQIYPNLQKGWVLLALNAQRIEKRPAANTALNKL